MDSGNLSSWKTSLTGTFEEFTTQLIAFTPELMGALALILGGWIIAYILRFSCRKLIRGFGTLFQDPGRNTSAEQRKMKRSYAVIISNTIFWVVMIFFITAATNLLGWTMISSWMANLISHLPNLISGLLIILAGILLGNAAKTAVIKAADSAGISQASMSARITQIVIIFTSLIIGIEQIGINVDFLTNVLIVIVGVLLAGGAMAFGLGARTLIANIIGAQYLRKHCRIGELMHIGEIEGQIIDVTQTSVILDTDYGRTLIPAKQFQEHIVSFKSTDNPISSGTEK